MGKTCKLKDVSFQCMTKFTHTHKKNNNNNNLIKKVKVKKKKNTGLSCHFLLKGIFLNQEWTCVSCTCRQILYHWATGEDYTYICMYTHTHAHSHTNIYANAHAHTHTHIYIYEKTILSRCDHLKLFYNCYTSLKNFRKINTLSNKAVGWSIKKDQN